MIRRFSLRIQITSGWSKKNLRWSKCISKNCERWNAITRKTSHSLRKITRKNWIQSFQNLKTPKRQLTSWKWCMRKSFRSKKRNMKLRLLSYMKVISRKLLSWLKLLTTNISSVRITSERELRQRRKKEIKVMQGKEQLTNFKINSDWQKKEKNRSDFCRKKKSSWRSKLKKRNMNSISTSLR